MKYKILTVILIAWFNSAGLIMAQENDDCKVLMPEIAGTYKGKCKKGLAHGRGDATGVDHYVGHFSKGLPDGNGTYTWANGDVYKGEFLKGKRDGEGTLKISLAGRDSLVSGIWKEDNYMGPVPEKPKVIRKVNLDKYDFTYISNIKNRVMVSFWQNGHTNMNVENISIVSSSGANVQRGRDYGIDYITYPVEIKVNYTTYNKLHTQLFYVTFEFKISEPGDWQLKLYN